MTEDDPLLHLTLTCTQCGYSAPQEEWDSRIAENGSFHDEREFRCPECNEWGLIK